MDSILFLFYRWLTYVASMSFLEEHENGSSVAVALLVTLRLLPSVLIGPLGGILADQYDRKIVMVLLDLLSALVALLYALSYYLQSIPLLLISTALQETLTGLYEPSRSAILPMLVSPAYLPKATTLTGMVWSTMTAIGAGLSGLIVHWLGISACFGIDAATYLASALLLAYGVHGKYAAVSDDEPPVQSSSDDLKGTVATSLSFENEIPKRRNLRRNASSFEMLQEALLYLWTSPYGPFVLIKGCGALLFGSSDVITVVFSEREGSLDSLRLGWMFASVGVGCILGPTLTDHFWNSHQEGQMEAWQWASSLSYAVIGVGYLMIGHLDRFWLKCAWNVLRASGTAVLWIDSSLLLQTTTPSIIMGRVMAIDLSLATAGESVSALAAGFLLDEGYFTADGLATLLGIGGLLFSALWLSFVRRTTSSLTSKKTLDILTISTELIRDDEAALELQRLR